MKSNSQSAEPAWFYHLMLFGFLCLFPCIDSFAQKPETTALAEGQKVYMATCNNCHKADAKVGTPGYLMLAQMPPRAILAALETGKMRVQAKELTTDQRKAVSQWLTGKVLAETPIPKEAYDTFSFSGSKTNVVYHSGWGGTLEGTGYLPISATGRYIGRNRWKTQT